MLEKKFKFLRARPMFLPVKYLLAEALAIYHL